MEPTATPFPLIHPQPQTPKQRRLQRQCRPLPRHDAPLAALPAANPSLQSTHPPKQPLLQLPPTTHPKAQSPQTTPPPAQPLANPPLQHASPDAAPRTTPPQTSQPPRNPSPKPSTPPMPPPHELAAPLQPFPNDPPPTRPAAQPAPNGAPGPPPAPGTSWIAAAKPRPFSAPGSRRPPPPSSSDPTSRSRERAGPHRGRLLSRARPDPPRRTGVTVETGGGSKRGGRGSRVAIETRRLPPITTTKWGQGCHGDGAAPQNGVGLM